MKLSLIRLDSVRLQFQPGATARTVTVLDSTQGWELQADPYGVVARREGLDDQLIPWHQVHSAIIEKPRGRPGPGRPPKDRT